MLRTRVVTALALMALLLPSLFFLPQAGWTFLVSVFIGLAAWEWGGLIGIGARGRVILGGVMVALCVLFSLAMPGVVGIGDTFLPASGWVVGLYALAAGFWCLAMPLWLKGRWSLRGGAGVLIGALILLPTWLAMVQLRMLGAEILLGIFAMVWMADIAAYFSGKAFGQHKLAPEISPGKTWEGAVGACIGVIVYGLVLREVFELRLFSMPLWLFVLVALTAISIVGDLFESLLKRKAGIKDSSNILPGHGGVLDRIDSLTSTLPVVALIWLLFVHQ